MNLLGEKEISSHIFTDFIRYFKLQEIYSTNLYTYVNPYILEFRKNVTKVLYLEEDSYLLFWEQLISIF